MLLAGGVILGTAGISADSTWQPPSGLCTGHRSLPRTLRGLPFLAAKCVQWGQRNSSFTPSSTTQGKGSQEGYVSWQ